MVFRLSILAYENHRQRVHLAKPLIDSGSPRIHAGNYTRLTGLGEDSKAYEVLAKKNVHMKILINRIMRTVGTLNTFRKSSATTLDRKTVYFANKRLRKLEVVNRKFGLRLLNVKGELKTRRPMAASMRNRRKPRRETFNAPMGILSKYSHIKLPENIWMLQKLLRPKIYIDLEVLNTRPLGRVIIQLYTEAAPQVVLEFVRVCSAHAKEKFNILRLFPSLWCESELVLDTNSLALKSIEYDKRALDHAAGPGILSFAGQRALKNLKRPFLNFSISFKPLRVLNGKRVAFGMVKHGRKILDCIQDYGTKNGKPIKQISVTDCGLFR